MAVAERACIAVPRAQQETARGLATLARRARAALALTPAAKRQRWLRAAPSEWPRLTQPRALLKELLQQAGIELVDDRPAMPAFEAWFERLKARPAFDDAVMQIPMT